MGLLLQLFKCLFIARGDDLFSDRVADFEVEEGEEDDEENYGISAAGTDSKIKLTIRKEFPESWIFDGSFELGYTKI